MTEVKQFYVFALLVIFPFSVIASEEINSISAPLVSSRIISVSLGLLLVLFVFFLLVFLLKRIPSIQSTKNGCLNIVETLYIGNKERLLLIQVGQEQILISANAQKIETLHVLPEPLDIHPSDKEQSSFKKQLMAVVAGRTNHKGEATQAGN